MTTELEPIPNRSISLLGTDGCGASAACLKRSAYFFERLGERFFGVGIPREKQVVAADLAVEALDMEVFETVLRRTYKGSGLRNVRSCRKKGYVTHRFSRANHVPDIYAINTSKEHRSGGAMKATYLRSIEELGGAPKHLHALEVPVCPRHHDTWWGVFQPEPGYVQGTVVTDERLVGYVFFKRLGEFAMYSLIIGHGDHLNDGIIQMLHYDIVEWITAQQDPEVIGLRSVMYAGYNQGGDGLRRWKKKMGFVPVHYVLASEEREQLLSASESSASKAVDVATSSVSLVRKVFRRLRGVGRSG